jgi:hypothetical protein
MLIAWRNSLMPKKPLGSPTFKTSLAKTSKSDSSVKMPVAKKTPSFSDPTPLPKFDPAYDAKTKKIAKQTSDYEVGAAARANARAPKPKNTPAKGGAGYIGIGGKKS